MKNKFYFFNAGFRKPEAWKRVRAELAGVCASQGSLLELERSNEQIIRGVYREEEVRTFTVLDQRGNSNVIDLKTFAQCEFILNAKNELLIVKNPSRGSIKSLISRFQDASFFQMFVEPIEWNLWDAFSTLAVDNTDRTISRIDVLSYPYSSVMEGNLVISGKLTPENVDRFRKGRLARLHGLYAGKSFQRFIVSSNGILKVSGSMSFDEAVSFSMGWMPTKVAHLSGKRAKS